MPDEGGCMPGEHHYARVKKLCAKCKWFSCSFVEPTPWLIQLHRS